MSIAFTTCTQVQTNLDELSYTLNTMTVCLEGMRPVAREKDPEKQQEVFKKVNEDMIQPHAKKIEQLLIQNGTGFLVGNAVRIYIFKGNMKHRLLNEIHNSHLR